MNESFSSPIIKRIVLPFYTARGVGYLGVNNSLKGSKHFLGFSNNDYDNVDDLAKKLNFIGHRMFPIGDYNLNYEFPVNIKVSLMMNSDSRDIPSPSKFNMNKTETANDLPLYWATESEVQYLIKSKMMNCAESVLTFSAFSINRPFFNANSYFQ